MEKKMAGMIKKLKAQKKQAECAAFDEGQKEGAKWAMNADYSELVHAAERFDPFEHANQIGGVHCNSVLKDDTLNDTFEALFDERSDLFKVNDNGLISSEAEQFISGWIEGVRSVWEEVSQHLND